MRNFSFILYVATLIFYKSPLGYNFLSPLYLNMRLLLSQGYKKSPGIIPLAIKDAFSIIQEVLSKYGGMDHDMRKHSC
jgi:hypothetical protein